MEKVLATVGLVFLLPTLAVAADFGTVKYLIGEASRGGSTLHLGDSLKPGDEITTGPRGLVRLVLAEGVAMQIGPGSRVRLENKSGQPTTAALLKGYLLSKVKKGGDDIKYRVRTKTASLGVRGTAFFVKEEGDGRTFFCLCEGTVVASWRKGEQLQTAKHHDHPEWLEGGNPKPDPAPMGSEHTDAEIAALTALLP